MKCILFDLDETIFDHRYSSQMGIAELRNHHPELNAKSVEELENLFWDMLHSKHSEVLSGKMTLTEARLVRIAALFNACNCPIPEDKLNELSVIYRKAYESNMRAIPGVIDVITKLRELGYKIIVITNGFRKMQMEKIQKCRIENLIDDFITSEEVGEGKPNPKIFLEALKRNSTNIEDAIVIGDAWDLDILGANPIGIKSIWLNRRNQICPNPKMAKEIFDVSEILTVI